MRASAYCRCCCSRDKYEAASAEVMSILSTFDPNMVVFGLDEAALDITEYCRSNNDLPPDEVRAADTSVIFCLQVSFLLYQLFFPLDAAMIVERQKWRVFQRSLHEWT